jgi:hypothetical protein
MNKIVLVTLTLTLFAGPVAADKKSEKQMAAGHFKNGVALYGEGKHAEALAEFERAYQIAPHPLLHYNIAIAYRAMSRYDQAQIYLEKFLAEGPGAVTKKQLQRGEDELSELNAFVAEVTLECETEVRINVGTAYGGMTPLPRNLVLGPGRHTIVASKPGYETIRKEVVLASADRITVKIDMRPLPPPEPMTPIGQSEPREDEPDVKHVGLMAGFGTNVRDIGDTGAPIIGASAQFGRLALGVDAVLVAYAIIPTLRYRIFGEELSVHAQASVPVAFKDGSMNETFTAMSFGLAGRYRMTPWSALRLEATMAYAGSERPVTVPVIVGTEVWF